jgi:peptide/nickel transport system substrate-binding protein
MQRSLRRIVVALAVVLLVASGCSSDDDTGGGQGGSATTVASSDVDPDGVLRIGFDLNNPGAPWAFDPTANQSQQTLDGWYYILYGRFLRPTLEGTLEPDLAESTTVDDPTTITIELREGLTFSDGSPFDAAAVKAGLERSLDVATPGGFSEAFFNLETVTVEGPTTVKLGIPNGTAASWHDSFLPSFQSTIVKADGFDPLKPIGAGPFSLTSYTPAKEATYTRSESYWDAEAITLGGIELTQVANESVESATAALQADQVDIALTSPAQIPALTGDLDLFTQADGNQTVTLMMCKASGPLADARVRIAINKALDREAISAAVYADTAEPALGMWPAGHRFSDPDLESELDYDVEGAKQLMAEAGYADGFEIPLHAVGVFNLPEAAEVIQQQLSEIGIDMTITVAANFVGEYLGVNAPGLGLYPGSSIGVEKLNQWNGEALVNTCDYNDPDLDAAKIELGKVTQSSDEAAAAWQQANEIVVGEALSGFVLFRSVLAGYNTETVGGVSIWPKGSVIVPNPRETWMTPG